MKRFFVPTTRQDLFFVRAQQRPLLDDNEQVSDNLSPCRAVTCVSVDVTLSVYGYSTGPGDEEQV